MSDDPMSADHVNGWHRVWSNRAAPSPDDKQTSVLQQLIALDGFDTPLGAMGEEEWRAYVAMFALRAGIAVGDSICEVGCGSGAFLLPFHENGFLVSGIDYSVELIRIAQEVMPDRAAAVERQEAIELPVEPMDSVVVANHVIHYFPSLEYAGSVLTRMLRKAKRVAAVSGVPDAGLKGESETARRGLLTREAYESKYRGLDILYFEREWLARIAAANGFGARFFDHEMPGFAQNQFRFDCVMTRIAEPNDKGVR